MAVVNRGNGCRPWLNFEDEEAATEQWLERKSSVDNESCVGQGHPRLSSVSWIIDALEYSPVAAKRPAADSCVATHFITRGLRGESIYVCYNSIIFVISKTNMTVKSEARRKAKGT